MLIKIVTLFLVGMIVLAMFGKLRLPKGRGPKGLLGGGRCAACGRPRIGKGPCPCGKDRT
ncbi:hypothetical protein [Limimaricola hongkongensis]|uniref:Uncharacterized protein n=1 Tax=Limimaricola hongkongensis DSM 17492 TaxID=1122180 RepID=A0A017HCP9_9RHOB|nr:hypothetical protein [Limimaricola hongkongensis]EYD72060.1 hypothetical protein Lokhon_02132 [Limimaricola hongkongensis DSM 17492]